MWIFLNDKPTQLLGIHEVSKVMTINSSNIHNRWQITMGYGVKPKSNIMLKGEKKAIRKILHEFEKQHNDELLKHYLYHDDTGALCNWLDEHSEELKELPETFFFILCVEDHINGNYPVISTLYDSEKKAKESLTNLLQRLNAVESTIEKIYI